MHWIERSTVRLSAEELAEALHKLEAWNAQNPIPVNQLSTLLISSAADSRAQMGINATYARRHEAVAPTGVEIGDSLRAVAELSTSLVAVRAFLANLAESVTRNSSLQLND